MANKIVEKIRTVFAKPDFEETVKKRVKEEVDKAKSYDIFRFSPRGMIVNPSGTTSNAKPTPSGISFGTLRDFADYYPIARSCVEFRKSQITHLDFNFSPVEITDETVQDKKNIQNAKELQEFFKHPTGKKEHSFTNWIKQILEDLLVIDAVAIYRRKNRGGKVIGYLPVDGATIEMVVNPDGTTPDYPDVAYKQKINGMEVADLTTKDLIYGMMTPRTFSAYGFAPLETLIITVSTALKLQSYSLSMLCYDDKTEILTVDGWKHFKDLTDDDVVATRSKTGKFEWQKPLSRHEFDFNGNLVRFKNATVDLFVTPNHRMLTDYRTKGGLFEKENMGIIKRAEWFVENDKNVTQNYLAPTKSIWNGESPEYFILDEIDINIDQRFSGYALCGRDKDNKPIRSKTKFLTDKKRRVIHLPEIKIDINDWMAFLGIYLAEGWCRKANSKSKHEVYVSQKRTSDHWVEIDELLNRLPFRFKYNERTWKWSCCDKQLWSYLEKLGHSYNKYIPSDIKNYDRELLDVLWKWMCKGDGGLQGQTMVYSTVSKKLADDVQEILQKIGFDPRVFVRSQPIGRIIKGKKNPIKTTRPIFKIAARISGHRSLTCASWQHYEGKVNSVKVPNGIVYVRRDGNAIWCGNTEGNVPEGFVTLPRDIASSRDQLKEWQDAWDAMISGDPRFQRKLKFLPEGMEYKPAKTAEDMTFERFEKWLLSTTCFDDQTEILTNTGWKFFSELDKTELVATRNVDGVFEWQKPTEYQEYFYEGEMIEFKNQSVDLLVTPDHRMLTTYNHGKIRGISDYKIERAGDLVGKDGHLMPATSVWNGKDLEYFVIPKTNYVHGLRGGRKEIIKVPSIKIKMEDWCAFLGLWLADGWVTGSKGGIMPPTVSKTINGTRKSVPYKIGISQKEKSKTEKIWKMLNSLPFRWMRDKNQFTTCNISLWKYLFNLGNVYTKRIPREILELSSKHLEILWDWYVLGDGYRRVEKTTRYVKDVAISVNHNLLGDFQELLQKIGYDGTINKRKDSGYCINGRTGLTKPSYYISRRGNKHINLKAKPKIYTGKVYDCTVPNGTLYVRRNGRPAWTGNCSVFGIHPSAIGFNFDINRSTASTMWEAGRERGLFPTALFLKEILDRMIQEDLGYPNMQFTWTNIDPTNKAEEAKVVTSLINSGLMSIDEWRLGEGLKPVGVKDPFLMTPVGPIFVKDLQKQSDAGQLPVAPYQPTGAPKNTQSTRNLPIPSQGKSAVDVMEEIKKWKKSAINDWKRKVPPRDFKSDILDDRTCFLIKKGLMNAKDKVAISTVFKPFLDKEHFTSNALLNLYDGITDIIA